jgi:hypothetical protein
VEVKCGVNIYLLENSKSLVSHRPVLRRCRTEETAHKKEEADNLLPASRRTKLSGDRYSILLRGLELGRLLECRILKYY